MKPATLAFCALALVAATLCLVVPAHARAAPFNHEQAALYAPATSGRWLRQPRSLLNYFWWSFPAATQSWPSAGQQQQGDQQQSMPVMESASSAYAYASASSGISSQQDGGANDAISSPSPANDSPCPQSNPKQSPAPADNNASDQLQSNPEQSPAPADNNASDQQQSNPEQSPAPADNNASDQQQSNPEQSPAPADNNASDQQQSNPEQSPAPADNNASDQQQNNPESSPEQQQPVYNSPASSSSGGSRSCSKSDTSPDALYSCVNAVRANARGFTADYPCDWGRWIDSVSSPRPAFKRSSQLDSSAQRHSSDMASRNFMTHDGSDGVPFDQRIQAAGWSGMPQSEDIAAGQASAHAVVMDWMCSEAGHRESVMGCDEDTVGVATAWGSDQRPYFTMDLGCSTSNSCRC